MTSQPPACAARLGARGGAPAGLPVSAVGRLIVRAGMAGDMSRERRVAGQAGDGEGAELRLTCDTHECSGWEKEWDAEGGDKWAGGALPLANLQASR